MSELIDVIDSKFGKENERAKNRCLTALSIFTQKIKEVELDDNVKISTGKDLIYVAEDCKEIHDDFINKLKERGYKVTTQKPSVFNTMRIFPDKRIDLTHEYCSLFS